MRNIKFISVFAAIGFILSFVFGLFSHSSFIHILLKALIFGLCFFGLGVLLTFIFNKFLADSNGDDFQAADFSDLASKSSVDQPKVGQHVDIVVEDEDLPSGDSENHFVVGDNHQMLKKTDIKEDVSSSAVEVGDQNNSFVPVREVENVQNFSGAEPVSPKEIKQQENSDIVISDDDIDTLPDMESLALAQEGDSDDSVNDSFTDSGFTSSATTYKKSDGSTPDIKDASLIAKAISTALAEEDS